MTEIQEGSKVARVGISLSLPDAQALYDHTGTMPFVRGSWSGNVRAALSESLAREKQPTRGGNA